MYNKCWLFLLNKQISHTQKKKTGSFFWNLNKILYFIPWTYGREWILIIILKWEYKNKIIWIIKLTFFFTSWYEEDKIDFDCWLSRKRILSSLKSLIRFCKCRIRESWFISAVFFGGIGSNLTFFGGSICYDVDRSSWWFELFNIILCLVKLKNL